MPFDVQRYTKDFFKLPSPTLQKRWVREWEATTVHTRGRYPKDIIEARRPYEDPETKKYRQLTYEPITKDPFSRAITNFQRVFSQSAVSFYGPEPLEEYLEQPLFSGTNFHAFFNQRVFRRMIEDANGFLVWWVHDIPELNVEVAPEPILVLSRQVKHHNRDVFSWLSLEKSEVRINDPAGGPDKILALEGKVYYIVTENDYFKLSQYGNIEDGSYELIPHYTHRLGEKPVFVLGGNEECEEDKKTGQELSWYTTFFSAAIPFGNECIRQFSDHQGVMVNSTSPIREVDAPTCPGRGCKKGVVTRTDKNNKVTEAECQTCHGSGRVIPAGPHGIMWRAESTLMNEGKGREIPVMRFLHADVNIIRYSGEYWEKLFDKMERALHLLFVTQAQSGAAKNIDREDRVSMLDFVATHFFQGIMRKSAIIVGRLRNMQAEVEKIGYNLPPTFVAKTEEDLNEEQKALSNNSVSPLYRIEASLEHAQKRFPGNIRVSRMMRVMAKYDPFFGYSTIERTAMTARGGIPDEMLRRSTYGPMAVQILVEQKGVDFLDKEYKVVQDALDDIIIDMVPEPEPQIEFNPLTGEVIVPEDKGNGEEDGSGEVPQKNGGKNGKQGRKRFGS